MGKIYTILIFSIDIKFQVLYQILANLCLTFPGSKVKRPSLVGIFNIFYCLSQSLSIIKLLSKFCARKKRFVIQFRLREWKTKLNNGAKRETLQLKYKLTLKVVQISCKCSIQKLLNLFPN